MEKRKSGLQWWFNLSISGKTLLMQSVIIFLPLAILVYFLLSVSYMDYASHAAKTSYEYARFTLDSLEAEMMQIKSACNVLLSHSQVQNLLTHPEAVEDPAEMERWTFGFPAPPDCVAACSAQPFMQQSMPARPRRRPSLYGPSLLPEQAGALPRKRAVFPTP